MPSLFDPIQLGAIRAPNRILMAPLTRGRATRDHVPTALMAQYYAQRAGAGLIVSEATGIGVDGLGWPFAPGIWSDEQVANWRVVTDAVRREGGRIVCQLWHMGRLVHPDLGGAQPVSASATTAPGDAHTYEGKKPNVQARALRLDEIPRVLADYDRAARNAVRAGFDGVQIHAANGYLIDQFLRDGTNLRDDDYGGTIENRVRLLREVAQTVADAVGADRTGVRLSPFGSSQGVSDSDPLPLFTAAAASLKDAGIAWLEVREPRAPEHAQIAPAMRAAFGGPFVLNSDYDGPRAQAALDTGEADAIAFGRTFLANPDLPERLRGRAPLNRPDPPTFYSHGPEGYVDYPRLGD